MRRLASLLVISTSMQRFLCGSFRDCEFILANESITCVSAGEMQSRGKQRIVSFACDYLLTVLENKRIAFLRKPYC